MKIMQWKLKNVLVLAVSIIISYLLIRKRTNKYYDFVKLPKAEVADVWEFVADFSNMKILNPTIHEFHIVSESGNFDHWKYTVKYDEHLSNWPHLRNSAMANFDVKSVSDAYYINSEHSTCFFSWFCLKSRSEMKFTKSETKTEVLCEESIEYECPAIMSLFCYKEVKYQRDMIMHNLKVHFHNKQK